MAKTIFTIKGLAKDHPAQRDFNEFMENKMIKGLTKPKTYCFFQADINKAVENGWTPKEIFRLGVYAKENNPQLISRIRELEEDKLTMAAKLQKLAKRLYELEGEQS